MPQLPTLTVSDAQAQRMLAAYGSAEAYTEWLTESIIDFVVTAERKARYEEFEVEQRAWDEQIRNELRNI